MLEEGGSRDSLPNSGPSASVCLAGHGEALSLPWAASAGDAWSPNDALITQPPLRPSSHRPASLWRSCCAHTWWGWRRAVLLLPSPPTHWSA